MFSRLVFVLSFSLGLAACGADHAEQSEAAGIWLLCGNDACSDTHDVGWYFPPDHGALQRVTVVDGKICAEPVSFLDDSSWQDTDGGGVLVNDGVASYELGRHGEHLDALSDSIAFDDPSARYMVRVANSPDPC